MINLVTIIFSLISFCVIWFLIFKFILIIDQKKKFKNIEEKIENQSIKTDLIDSINESKTKLRKEKEVKIKVTGKLSGMSDTGLKINNKQESLLSKLNIFKKCQPKKTQKN